jgi:6-phospho-beta-glucosidase
MTNRLAILGGSSPWTVALINALAAAGGPPSLESVTLHGRNADRLRAVERYARAGLAGFGIAVRGTLDLTRALEGATLVVNQIRFGGLRGRADDEEVAEAFGVAADETLGPAALRCALRIAPALTRLGRTMAATCPGARVVNLINPLSVSTAILAASVQCVGICELPIVTVREAAGVLGVPVAALGWAYDGLNHRGFIHHLSVDGEDQLPRLLSRLGERTIGGIPGRVIDELGALPLKYFGLLRAERRPPVHRAAFLTNLGAEVFRELQDSPAAPPPSLTLRDLSWYPDAVVPAIVAMSSAMPRRLVVNLPRADGVVVEVSADVSETDIAPVAGPPPNAHVAAWLERFARHERAVLRAVAEPDLENVVAALEADPVLVDADVVPLAHALCRDARQESETAWTFA